MKFSTKLIGLLSGLFLLSFGIAGYAGYTFTTGILEANAKEKLELRVFHTMDKIDRMLFERYKDIQFLASDPVINSAASTPEQISERLKEFLNMNQFYLSLAFFDLKRTRIADTSGTDIGKQYPFTGYWPGIAAGKNFLLMINISETIKKAVLYSASVVKDKKGKPIGVVVSRISVDSLYEIIRQAAGIRQTEKEVDIELMDKNGLLLYSDYNKDGTLKALSDDWEAIKGFVSKGGKIGSARHYHKGEDEISAFAQEQGYLDFKGNDWILVICTPTEKAFAGILGQKNKLLIIFSGIGFIVLLSTIIFSHAVTKPLKELNMAASEIGRGNLDVHMEVKSKDEIGQLARAFNNMALDIKRFEEELRKYSGHLEELVRERTRDIEIGKEAAEAGNRAKSEFIANMSHELSTPLNSVIGFSEVLLDELSGKLNEKQKEYVKDILDSGRNLYRVIADIIELSKIETGNNELRLGCFNLKDLLVSSMAIFDDEKFKHKLNMDIEIAPEADIEIEGDIIKLKQVMFNLLSNAVKFTQDGGSVQVTARKVTPPFLPLDKGRLGGVMPDRALIEISVTDTGIGIKPEDISRLFTPFQQFESPYIKKYAGTGLGLALTKKLVEAQGGRIWAESEFGKGSKFTFVIPVRQGYYES